MKPLDTSAAADADFARTYWRHVSQLDAHLSDLTPERVDAEEFRLLADNMPILSWIANGDGYITWYNRRWYDYTGATPDELRGWGWQSVHHPEELPAVMARWTAAIDAGEPFEMVFPLRGADGKFRPFLTRIQPLRDAGGRVARWFGVNAEIGDQVAAETALRESRAALYRVLDSMGEAFIAVAPDFTIVQINAEGLRLDGRPREEILGRHLLEVWPENRDLPIWPAYQRAMAGRATATVEYRHHGGNRRDIWLEVRIYPVDAGLAVFYRDITSRKRAEASARTAAIRHEALAAEQAAILGQLAEGVIVANRRGRITFVNDAATRLHGVARLDVGPDQYTAAYSLLTESGEPYPTNELPLTRTVVRGETVTDERWRIRRPDGTEVVAIGSSRPIRDSESRMIGAVLTVRDDTERANNEAALARRLGQVQALAAATLKAAHSETLPAALDAVSEAALDIIGARRACVTVTREGRHPLVSLSVVEGEDASRGGRKSARLRAMRVEVLQGKRPAHLPRKPGAVPGDGYPERRGVLAVPLIGRDGRSLGFIELCDRRDGCDFDDADEAMLVQLAQLATTAIEQTTAEHALRESEARFRNITNFVDQMIWSTRPDGFHDFYNQRWYDYTGMPEGSTDGEAWNGVFHPDDQDRAWQIWSRCLRTGEPYHIEYRLRHRSGQYRWVIGRAQCVRDEHGRIERWYGTCTDIHDLKTAETALREEGRTLETLNRIGTALSGELDIERLVQMVTDAGRELTGARYGAFFYNVLREDGEKFLLYTLSGAERADFERFGMPRPTPVFGPTFGGEGVIRSDNIRSDPRYGRNAPHSGMPHGHLPVCSYLAVPVISRSGEVLGALLFGHPDPGIFNERHERLISGIAAQAAIAIDNARLFKAAQFELEERRLTEARLQELNETLEQRVEREVAERALAEEALRQAQKMEAVGQLTGGIAHDFNNLLTVVTGNIDMAIRALNAAGVDDARSRRALDNAMKGAERAAALTQRLLAFSRRQPLAPKPLDVDKLLLGMSDLVNRALGETIRFEVVTAPGLWRVEVDPNQLESALLNLAVNARDAMPEGGKLTIETANARLDEAYCATHAEVSPGSYVVLCVTDTGEGMSRETIARVFEPFFTTKEVGRGTGLGLSMVYGFVKQSGGHVKIYSELGEGTTVKIYLPRLMSDAEVEDAPPVDHGIEVSRRRETVLVVEDDDDVRSYTVESLRELGYRVLEAHDGPSGLRLIERRDAPIDLLFTDVVMPGMSGREMAEHARVLQPGLRVLYTSGYTRNAIVHGGRLDPGVEMIAKPFTYSGLAAKIRDMLDAGRTGRVLVVDGDPATRRLSALALDAAGYNADEAANGLEALATIRASGGRYDAVVIDTALPDRTGDALAAEMRALHVDLPILLLAGENAATLETRFAAERCTDVLAKPFTPRTLQAALAKLGLRCERTSG